MHQNNAIITNPNKKSSNKDKKDGLSAASILLADEGTKDMSVAVTGLFNLLKNINVTPERIAQNQWRSVNQNGEVEFYY